MDDAYQPETRAPPPTGPPPAYARVLNRVYPYSLRPILLFSTVISFIYLVLLGAGNFKDAGHKEETGKLKLFDIVCGALFMGAAAVEVFGFFAVYTQRLPLARTYSWASLLAFAAVIASELLGIVVTFTLKTDIVNVCTARHTGRTESDGGLLDISPSNNGTLTEAQARTYCESQWSSDRTWTIIWLIVTIFVGTFFVSFSFGYVRQLLDPLSVRERPAATFWGRRQQQAAPSAQYGQGAPYDTDAYYQTPYNGGHYANNPYSYPPPPGPPPPGHVPPHYGQQDRMPPTYDGVNRPSSVDLDDAKRAPYGHQQAGPFSDDHQVTDGPRPGSSRGVHAGGDEDDDERRGSFDTLKGDDTDAQSKSHNKSPRDDDYVPRI